VEEEEEEEEGGGEEEGKEEGAGGGGEGAEEGGEGEEEEEEIHIALNRIHFTTDRFLHLTHDVHCPAPSRFYGILFILDCIYYC
jgi:hypothetical protein